jgi:hypothetical protein
MTFQERIARQTTNAGEALFQSARAMPEDKLDWKPADDARTALDIVRECAYTPAGLPGLLAGNGTDPAFLEEFGRLAAEARTWTTLEAVEAGYRKNIETALGAIRACPDEALDQVYPVPFGAGRLTGEQIVMMCYWNMVYHMGQINYIQTQYGDREMHSGM